MSTPRRGRTHTPHLGEDELKSMIGMYFPIIKNPSCGAYIAEESPNPLLYISSDRPMNAFIEEEWIEGGIDQYISPDKWDPVWVSDDDAAICMRCDKKFTMLIRKHHCRRCGFVVCGSCTTEVHKKRVCLYCSTNYSMIVRTSDLLATFFRKHRKNAEYHQHQPSGVFARPGKNNDFFIRKDRPHSLLPGREKIATCTAASAALGPAGERNRPADHAEASDRTLGDISTSFGTDTVVRKPAAPNASVDGGELASEEGAVDAEGESQARPRQRSSAHSAESPALARPNSRVQYEHVPTTAKGVDELEADTMRRGRLQLIMDWRRHFFRNYIVAWFFQNDVCLPSGGRPAYAHVKEDFVGLIKALLKARFPLVDRILDTLQKAGGSFCDERAREALLFVLHQALVSLTDNCLLGVEQFHRVNPANKRDRLSRIRILKMKRNVELQICRDCLMYLKHRSMFFEHIIARKRCRYTVIVDKKSDVAVNPTKIVAKIVDLTEGYAPADGINLWESEAGDICGALSDALSDHFDVSTHASQVEQLLVLTDGIAKDQQSHLVAMLVGYIARLDSVEHLSITILQLGTEEPAAVFLEHLPAKLVKAKVRARVVDVITHGGTNLTEEEKHISDAVDSWMGEKDNASKGKESGRGPKRRLGKHRERKKDMDPFSWSTRDFSIASLLDEVADLMRRKD